MAPRTGTGERYATQVGEFWSGLARTLKQLDQLAAHPHRLDDEDALEALRRLQYTLHTAGERVFGLAPPPGAEPAHLELGAALAGARDATADVVDALEEEGLQAVALVVHEWRGALFRVRLARLRLQAPRREEPPVEVAERSRLRPALLAVALVAGGAGVFAFGATTDRWPLWLAGMLAVCGSALAYRP